LPKRTNEPTENSMDGLTREEVRIGRDEYLALVRDRDILDIIDAHRAGLPGCPGSLRDRIGELLDAGIAPNVIVGQATARATRRAALTAALRTAAPRAAGLVG